MPVGLGPGKKGQRESLGASCRDALAGLALGSEARDSSVVAFPGSGVFRGFAAILMAGTVVASCGGSSADSNPPTASRQLTFVVRITDNLFTPATLTVPAGTSVTWQWSADGRHSVVGTFGTDRVQSPVHAGSGEFTLSVSTPGTWQYECGVLGAAMSGTIVVQ